MQSITSSNLRPGRNWMTYASSKLTTQNDQSCDAFGLITRGGVCPSWKQHGAYTSVSRCAGCPTTTFPTVANYPVVNARHVHTSPNQITISLQQNSITLLFFLLFKPGDSCFCARTRRFSELDKSRSEDSQKAPLSQNMAGRPKFLHISPGNMKSQF